MGYLQLCNRMNAPEIDNRACVMQIHEVESTKCLLYSCHSSKGPKWALVCVLRKKKTNPSKVSQNQEMKSIHSLEYQKWGQIK